MAENNPEDESMGHRELPFSREIYIEKADFREEANRKFFRLKLGGEVRLKNAYIIKAEHCIKNEAGEVIEVHCTYDTKSKSGSGTEESMRKVKGTLHWVSVKHAKKADIKLYDRLFAVAQPEENKEVDFIEHLNPNSLVETTAFIEPSLNDAKEGQHYQFQRMGYFYCDGRNSENQAVFNRTVGLRDTWAKIETS
jgi:glutaminyl-tRNA synthetase